MLVAGKFMPGAAPVEMFVKMMVICYSLLLCTTQVCPNESHPSCFQEDADTLLFQGKGTTLDRGIHFSSVVSFAKVSRHVDRWKTLKIIAANFQGSQGIIRSCFSSISVFPHS